MSGPTDAAEWADKLAVDRDVLGRSSTAQRVAEVLRTRITEGLLPPGTKLSEEAIGGALGVSRNTLREAFRLLLHERLATHQLSRGVYVRVLTMSDVTDLYRVRRILETAALRSTTNPPEAACDQLQLALAEGELAAAEDRWFDVGTANMHLHQAIAALSMSPRVEEFMRQLLAELRLAFHVMNDPKTFHAPYLTWHRRLIKPILAGDMAAAERMLHEYLDAAERQLVDAFSKLESSNDQSQRNPGRPVPITERP